MLGYCCWTVMCLVAVVWLSNQNLMKMSNLSVLPYINIPNRLASISSSACNTLHFYQQTTYLYDSRQLIWYCISVSDYQSCKYCCTNSTVLHTCRATLSPTAIRLNKLESIHFSLLMVFLVFWKPYTHKLTQSATMITLWQQRWNRQRIEWSFVIYSVIDIFFKCLYTLPRHTILKFPSVNHKSIEKWTMLSTPSRSINWCTLYMFDKIDHFTTVFNTEKSNSSFEHFIVLTLS